MMTHMASLPIHTTRLILCPFPTHQAELLRWRLFLPWHLPNDNNWSIGFVEATIRGRVAELGYSLTREQGHGYAREAVEAVTVYLRTHLEACKISAQVNPANNRSIRLLNVLGFAPARIGSDGLIEFRLERR